MAVGVPYRSRWSNCYLHKVVSIAGWDETAGQVEQAGYLNGQPASRADLRPGCQGGDRDVR